MGSSVKYLEFLVLAKIWTCSNTPFRISAKHLEEVKNRVPKNVQVRLSIDWCMLKQAVAQGFTVALSLISHKDPLSRFQL